jgi:hypothetical protein
VLEKIIEQYPSLAKIEGKVPFSRRDGPRDVYGIVRLAWLRSNPARQSIITGYETETKVMTRISWASCFLVAVGVSAAACSNSTIGSQSQPAGYFGDAGAPLVAPVNPYETSDLGETGEVRILP